MRVRPLPGRASVLATACLVVIALVTGLAGQGSADTKPTDVRVTNTSAEALPVVPQGVTAVSGGVAVTNTPTVNLASNAVRVSNESLHVSALGEVPREPFLHFVVLAAPNQGCVNCHSLVLFTVPEGKVALIEQVSASFTTHPGAVPEVVVAAVRSDPDGTRDALMFVPMVRSGRSQDATGARDVYVAAEQVRMYGRAGSRVVAGFTVNRFPDDTYTSGEVIVSGYFLPSAA